MSAIPPPSPWLAALQQRLLEVGGDFASLAAGGYQPGDAAALAERYGRLFMPPGRVSPALAELASRIAVDAMARFHAALASTDPALPRITSLHALHALWIDCGEAAYAEVAGTDAYAEAQAQFLAAMLE